MLGAIGSFYRYVFQDFFALKDVSGDEAEIEIRSVFILKNNLERGLNPAFRIGSVINVINIVFSCFLCRRIEKLNGIAVPVTDLVHQPAQGLVASRLRLYPRMGMLVVETVFHNRAVRLPNLEVPNRSIAIVLDGVCHNSRHVVLFRFVHYAVHAIRDALDQPHPVQQEAVVVVIKRHTSTKAVMIACFAGSGDGGEAGQVPTPAQQPVFGLAVVQQGQIGLHSIHTLRQVYRDGINRTTQLADIDDSVNSPYISVISCFSSSLQALIRREYAILVQIELGIITPWWYVWI